MAMMRDVAPSTYILAPRSETPPSGTPPLLPIPLPTSSPPLLLPSTDCRADVPEVTLPPRKRLCIAPGPRYEIGECSSAPTARPTGGFRADYGFVGTLDAEIRQDLDREVGYGITDTWDEMVEAIQEIAPTTLEGVNQRVMDLVTTIRQDTYEVYGRLDDAQDDRSLMSGQLNLLRKDRHSHTCMARLMKSEARASREAWVQSMDASDTACFEVRALRTTVLAQQTEIRDLRAADRRRQVQLAKALTLLRTLQTQMVALQSQQRLAGDLAHPEKKIPPRKSPRTRTPPVTTTTTTTVIDEQVRALIDQGVTNVLAECEATRSRNGEDSHDTGQGVRRTERATRECTYPDFMKCQPLNFKSTEGVVELTQWLERMEIVFRITNFTVENQIKFVTCTLLGSALTWWNSYVRTIGHVVAYAMTWTNLKKKMTDKYYPRGEIKKLEVVLWNLKVKESDMIEKYVRGLPDMIHGSVMASKPKTMQDAIEFTTELMDKKINTFAER
ncbi:putative reverse transcriptase domain-containing protein [Tanacetum coccineum]